MMPSSTVFHQIILLNLGELLHAFVKRYNLGVVLIAPTDVILSDEDVVQPDIIFISSKREHIVTPRNIQGAPDLVVEIFSERTTTIDQKQKRQLYEKFVVKEYWMIDPDVKSIEVLTLEEGRYTSLGIIQTGEIRSKQLQDFSVTAEAVFAS